MTENRTYNFDIKCQMEGVSIHLLSVSSGYITTSIPMHCHGKRCYEIHYVRSGKGIVRINDRVHDLEGGALYVTGPLVLHEQIPDSKDPIYEDCLYIQFEKDKINTDMLLYQMVSVDEWYGTDQENIVWEFDKIATEFREKRTGYINQIESLVRQCIIKLIRNYEVTSGRISTPKMPVVNLSDVKNFITEVSLLMGDDKITIAKLSNQLGMSSRQTERFLKQYYGKSFREKKQESKMANAALLLSESSMSITQIAEKVGYSSVQHFSYAFRKYFGMTPSKYRTSE